MSDRVLILIAGAGAPGIVETIYSIKNNPDNIDFKIVTTDIKDFSVGKYLSESFYKVPSPENEDYVPVLANYKKRKNKSYFASNYKRN